MLEWNPALSRRFRVKLNVLEISASWRILIMEKLRESKSEITNTFVNYSHEFLD